MTGADLSNIGYFAVFLTAVVGGFCSWLWCKPTDTKTLSVLANLLHSQYDFYAGQATHRLLMGAIRRARVHHEIFIGVSSMFLWLFYATADGVLTVVFRQHPVMAIKYYLRWKYTECRKFPQFWAICFAIMYMTAGSMLSLYLYSLPAPCEARKDCVATEASGVYIGRYHE